MNEIKANRLQLELQTDKHIQFVFVFVFVFGINGQKPWTNMKKIKKIIEEIDIK